MTELENNIDSKRTEELGRQAFQSSQPPLKWWPALLWSLLLSVFSVANPYLTQFATNLQTHSLYAGEAMQAGHVPYSDFFATNGVLYYLMSYAGTLLPVNILFGVFQFVALLIAGIYFYKISAYFSQSVATATNFSHWFYVFIFAVDFGGLYAGMFALPFMLTSIWFLIRYFERAVRDESFILYGIDAALVFLIYPKSIILWVVATVVLLVYNITHKHVARGFYQLLATLFGFLLIVYSVGYYAFETQILGLAIQQTFLYNLKLDFTHEHLVMLLGIVAVFLVFSGFLKSFVQTVSSLGQRRHSYFKVLILLAFLLQMTFILGNADFQWSQLVLLLPYGFVMSVIHLVKEDSEHDEDEEGIGYVSHQFFLPLLLALAIPLQPIYSYVIDGDVYQERVAVATYISEYSKQDEKIYTWDSSARIYLDSQRLSSAGLITAEPYLHNEDNQKNLVYDLNKNEAVFIVVNRGIPMLDEVKSTLEESYQLVDIGTSHFALYEKK